MSYGGRGSPGAAAADENGDYVIAVLAAQAAGHGPPASAATHTGDTSTVNVDLSLPGETVSA